MPRLDNNTKLLLIAGLMLSVATFAFDLSVELGVAGAVPYVTVVLLGLWAPTRTFAIGAAVFTTGLTLLGAYLSPDGGIPWVVFTNRALAISGVWLAAAVCLWYKHSEGIRRQEQLQAQGIIETAVDGIITISERGIIQAFNPAAEKIFGYAEEHVLGLNISMLMPSPYREEHDGYLARYLSTGEKRVIGIGREVVGQRRDGTLFPLEIAISEVILPDRRQFTGIVRDLTEFKKAQQLASLGELSAHIAHEIKNPIAGVQNVMDIFSDQLSDNADLQDLCHEVKKQLDGMNNLVRDLLSFARQMEPDRITYNLESLLDEVLSFASNDPALDNIEVTRNFNAEDPAVSLDPNMMSQALLNLVLNAAHAIQDSGSEAGRITVSLYQEPREFVVAITDNGHGIPPEKMAHIFEPFFTTRPRGTGLGLALCRKILAAHNGVIDVESTPGEQTAFTIRLPVLEALPSGNEEDA
jgi:two-component system sensor kinase FixL